ncbi:hypothetical protein ATN84_09785 [Paramesorhizobium deserti]|uniref:Uncharacterized protein n=1 Tax=Paramesorhizobium deserti TaxID=1494590 RepID=A0A135HWR1_9HYPH|nr:DUF6105 family protein [Paramesorhizobium deserti]KXF77633.1 hypothetical protein ATN84_09785 [Paramesorhizobium deserti]
MRYLLIFWAGPLALFWGWYFLSLNDVSFGTVFFSRQMHDLVFAVYGNVLDMDPQAIPPLAARACVVDSLILFAILAFRRRREIRCRRGRERYS